MSFLNVQYLIEKIGWWTKNIYILFYETYETDFFFNIGNSYFSVDFKEMNKQRFFKLLKLFFSALHWNLKHKQTIWKYYIQYSSIKSNVLKLFKIIVFCFSTHSYQSARSYQSTKSNATAMTSISGSERSYSRNSRGENFCF